jgi:hypothetical protein
MSFGSWQGFVTFRTGPLSTAHLKQSWIKKRIRLQKRFHPNANMAQILGDPILGL